MQNLNDSSCAPKLRLPTISVIIPVYNEAAVIQQVLQALTRDAEVEVIVVDGGSHDGTADLAAGLADKVIHTAPGRARQMNAGLAATTGEIVLFLHADTTLPPNALADLRQIAVPGVAIWGRFDVEIEGRSPLLPVVAAFMNLRSRFSGVATGDQAIFVLRKTMDQIGGVPDIAIMEDVALSKTLKRLGPPLCLRSKVRTSGRRWDTNGALRTITTMWIMRLLYVCGTSPDRLARFYARLRSG
ncbi:MAG: TIGR04283 family arsenosugar biosynthesis glycosyltransferase [Rhodobacterales bacterium]